MISSDNVSKLELQAAVAASLRQPQQPKKKHSKKSSLDDPLSGGGLVSGQQSSPIEQINHPDGPASAESEQSGVPIFLGAGGEERGRLNGGSLSTMLDWKLNAC